MSWRSASWAGMWSTTRRRIACTSATKPSRSAAVHTIGAIISTYVATQVQVAGHRAGLEQRLELPGLGPLLVVAAVAGQGAHQRPGGALGPQVGVDRPDRALARCGRSRSASGGRPAGWPPAGPATRRPAVEPALEDVDHVDVGDVVELVAAALAHRDHGERGVVAALSPTRARATASAASSVPAARSAISAAASSTPTWWARSRDGQAQQDAGGTPPAARPPPPRPGSPATGAGSCGSAPTARSSASRTAYAAGAGRAERRVGQLAPVLGVAGEVRGQRGAGAQHRAQPHRGALVVGDLGEHRRPGPRPRRPAAAARRGRRRGRRWRPGGSVSGGPRRRRAARCRPARRRAVLEAEADQLPGGGHRASPRRELGEAVRQRSPRGVELGPGGVDLREHGVLVEAALEVVGAVALRPRLHDRPSASGCSWTPQTPGAKRATCSSPRGRLGQHHGALGGAGDDVVVPLDAAGAGEAAGERVVGARRRPAGRRAPRRPGRAGCAPPRRRARRR